MTQNTSKISLARSWTTINKTFSAISGSNGKVTNDIKANVRYRKKRLSCEQVGCSLIFNLSHTLASIFWLNTMHHSQILKLLD